MKCVSYNIQTNLAFTSLDEIDQTYQTSTSEREHGDWNEGFEFKVTYHAQLFDSLQVKRQVLFHYLQITLMRFKSGQNLEVD